MNKYVRSSMWVGVSLLGAMALAACNQGASAQDSDAQGMGNAEAQFAQVVNTRPIKETQANAHQECHNVTTTRKKPVKDENQLLGTSIGAVAGGLLGNQVGGGSGKKLATVAGAVAGGYAGNKVQEHHQNNATEQVTQRKCRTVKNPTTKVVGYKVTYKYDGSTHTTRMDHDPGDRVKVKNETAVVGGN